MKVRGMRKIATNCKTWPTYLAQTYKEVSNTKETLTHEDISSDMILSSTIWYHLIHLKKEAIEAVKS